MVTLAKKRYWEQSESRTASNWGLRAIGKRIDRYIQLSQQRRALLEMDDHQLNDIGISRVEAVKIARSIRF